MAPGLQTGSLLYCFQTFYFHNKCVLQVSNLECKSRTVPLKVDPRVVSGLVRLD
jgi:hypothetical protein